MAALWAWSATAAVVSHKGNAVAVDFSAASGAAAVVVQGPAASTYRCVKKLGKSKFTSLQLGGSPCGVLVLSASGQFPDPKVDGDKLTLGAQSFSFDGKKLVMAKTAPPMRQ